MSNSIYIASNNKDMFSIQIPTFDSGAISTGTVAPEKNVSSSEMGFVASKSLISFGVMFICILIFIIFALLFKNAKKVEPRQRQMPERKRYYSEKVRQEQIETDYEEPKSENNLYRNSSKKRSSLSTPNSINKCIRAFLENTKEN